VTLKAITASWPTITVPAWRAMVASSPGAECVEGIV
jgi:hypothetical protein